MRRYKALTFQAFECGVDSTRRNVPLEALLNFFQNSAPIGFVFKTKNREQHGLFEGAQSVRHAYIVVLFGRWVKALTYRKVFGPAVSVAI